ncbi:acyltransferase [Paenibacillus segetis]|uniref:Acyltransferase 3 n=1 Tax=Paenibacillus segetis TaxID=1325360 RepID=A0ABQ1Y764_9BACL|nr:acyltransferase [Paenibacillus segetis]GGH14454.1 acyltransferase 3 [Paenibacillus segetis]
MTTIKKERVPELNIVRAICILGVITVHATSYATVQLTGSGYFILYNFFNIFMKFGTPTFIAMSAFVLFYNYSDRPLNRELIVGFYKKRLLYILLPYFLFSLFYFSLTQVIAGSTLNAEMISNFINKLLTGKAYTHLYFVFINVQFYLLFPFLLLLFKRYPKSRKWAIVAGIVIQWLFILGNKYQFHVTSRGSWCFTYFSYYMLGAWLGMYYPMIKEKFNNMISKNGVRETGVGMLLRGIWAVWLCSGVSHSILWYQSRLYGHSFNSLAYDLLYSIFAFTSLPVLMHAASMLLRKNKLSLLCRPLNRLGSLSFGVYLIHPFFLLLYRQLSPAISTAWVLHLWYIGGFIVALGCSWIVVGLAARYLPYAWMIFGNLPKLKKKLITNNSSAYIARKEI